MSAPVFYAQNEDQALISVDGDATSIVVAVDRDATISEVLDEFELATGELLVRLDRVGLAFNGAVRARTREVVGEEAMTPLELENLRARLVAKRELTQERETDEIVGGRTRLAYYYTGVADALEWVLAVRRIFERSQSQNGSSSYANGLPKDDLRHDGLLNRLEDDELKDPVF